METGVTAGIANFEFVKNEQVFIKTTVGEWLFQPSNLLSLILLLVIFVVAYLWYKRKLNISNARIVQAVALVFCCGWVIYAIGFFCEGTKDSLIALLMRPAISSLEMFVSHSDLLEVDEVWKDNALYMTFFTIIHFSAILLSGIVIIHYLGVRFASKIHLWNLKRKCGVIKNLYVFWNVDENSINLAEDICKNEGDDKVIVFIDSCVENDKNTNRLTFSHFFSHFSFSKELLDKVSSMNAILIRAKYLLNNRIGSDNDTLKRLGLDILINKSENTYFFLLSENEKLNILSALNLKNDSCVIEKSKQLKDNDKLEILCHAFRDSANRVFEWESTPSITIKVVDSAYLSVISLKSMCDDSLHSSRLCRQYLYHPVNFVDIDQNKGVATNCFSSLIVGFGETGQEALRFLFEFGQFPYDLIEKQNCSFKCSVCDADMDRLKGRFWMKSPALKVLEQGITYQNLDYTSTDFWNHLHDLLEELNYIVIAVGDDEKGISLAVDIYEYAERYRKNVTDKFHIFVRSYERVNEKLLFKVTEKYKETITVFGASSDIFVKSLIIDDGLLEMAQEFYYSYNQQEANPDRISELEKMTPVSLWKKRRDKVKTRLDYQDLLRKEEQDLSNCMHIYTKVKLIGGIEGLARLEQYRHIFEMKDTKEIKKRYVEIGFLENLARGEHIRWNAAHYAMGYVRMLKEDQVGEASCCKLRKKHLCLVPWEKLPEISTTDYQQYDRTVVQTTFHIVMK